MHGTVVGVLRGGPSREHDASLLSGHAAVANLPRSRFTIRDIYIDKQGVWHERGKPSNPADILRTVDVAFSTLHGEYGENGEIQRMLERFGVPYVGPNSINAHFSMHKVLSKDQASRAGLKTPRYYFVQTGADVDAIAYQITRTFNQPVIVKPVTWGSSHGIEIVGGYAPVHQAITNLLAEAGELFVEEMIRGTEASVAVVEGLRGEALYVLPPVEISASKEKICPGRFSKETQEQLMHAAKLMHGALGQRHYSQSDFIVSKTGIYFLELNSAVACNLSKESLLPTSLAAVGVPLSDFLSLAVESALV
jgi:D-alanine-D-alanine ligase